jgi:uncharacterized protein (UPF0335 family)
MNYRDSTDSNTTSVAQDQLQSIIDRIERLLEETDALKADIKEIKSEAKGNGFDVKVINRIINIRRQDPSERYKFEAVLELYMSALGMVAAPSED